MIKLQDFARERGVTDRQIQRLLQKYATEVDGLYQRKGPNGTWLSDEACEILRSKMKSNPISTVVDTREVDDLKEKLAAAEETIKNKEQYITALEAGNLRQQQRLNELEDNQLLLEATKKEKEILEGFIQDAKKEIEVLNDEKGDLSAEIKKRDEILEEERKTSQKLSNELVTFEKMSIIDFMKFKFKKGKK